LQTTNKASKRTTEYINKMSTAPVPTQKNNEQARVPKNIVSDPG